MALDTWTQKADFPVATREMSRCGVGIGKGYKTPKTPSFRGYVLSDYGTTAYEYDPDKDIWVSFTMGQHNAGEATIFALGKYIFVQGGAGSGGSSVSTLFLWNSETRTGANGANGYRQYGAYGGAVNGKGYVMGGYRNGTLSTCREYNPDTDTWEAKTSVYPADYDGNSYVMQDKVWCIGGMVNDKLHRAYNPATDTHATYTAPPTSVFLASACYSAGRGHIIGGWNAARRHEVYNPDTDTWEDKEGPPRDIAEAACFGLNGKIYVGPGYDAGDGLYGEGDYFYMYVSAVTEVSGHVEDTEGGDAEDCLVVLVPLWDHKDIHTDLTDSDGNFSIAFDGAADDLAEDKVAVFSWPDSEDEIGDVVTNV